jgi:hypothetical protein
VGFGYFPKLDVPLQGGCEVKKATGEMQCRTESAGGGQAIDGLLDGVDGRSIVMSTPYLD